MRIYNKNLLMIVFTISVFVLITACGGDGGGDSDLQTPSTDLTGTWNVEETQNGNCEGSTYPQYEAYTATVTQTGNDLKISFSSGDSDVDGTISGNKVTWSGTQPSDSGTSSIDFSGSVSDDGNTITGTATWTWTDGSYTCSGTTEVTATRGTQPASSQGNTLILTAKGDVHLTEPVTDGTHNYAVNPDGMAVEDTQIAGVNTYSVHFIDQISGAIAGTADLIEDQGAWYANFREPVNDQLAFNLFGNTTYIFQFDNIVGNYEVQIKTDANGDVTETTYT